MRVFIYEGYYPAGGTFMSYHIGRIFYQYFGMEVFCVGGSRKGDLFHYEFNFPTISNNDFEKNISEMDLLICNPSFSDQRFGLRLPCKKLCYVQGIRTFSLLDVFFDHYVFVSRWVKSFIGHYYGISGNVIPAFIDTELFYSEGQWINKSHIIPIIRYKYDDLVFRKFLANYKKKYFVLPDFEIYDLKKQNELAEIFRCHRYYLSFATMEGFGLPMLEAMASGCAVVGWDAGGNAEYTRHKENSYLSRYGDFESLTDNLNLILSDVLVAEGISREAAAIAKTFNRAKFDSLWVNEIESSGLVEV